MRIIKSILLSAVAALAAMSTFARPIRCLESAVNNRFEDAVDNEFWVWPEELATVKSTTRPTEVWNPEVGKWYSDFSYNGWVRSSSTSHGEFGDGFVRTLYNASYTYCTFLSIPAGTYRLSAMADELSSIFIVRYAMSGGGWVWDGLIKQVRTPLDYFDFRVSEDVLIAMQFRPLDSQSPITTWTNVSLRRIGE